jgi:nucleoid-associated protein YgaU
VRRAACLAALWLAATGASAEARVHVVRRGESLAAIAKQELGDVALWPALYRANRDRIKDPERIYPGQELTIPEPGSEGFGGGAPEAPAANAGAGGGG